MLNEDEILDSHYGELDAELIAQEQQRAFEQSFAATRGSDREIRATANKAPTPKQEQRSFAQQVNRQVAKGDSGGSGSKVQPKQVTAAEGTYKIQRGENLSGIAKRLGIDMNELARLNGIKDVNFIRAGDRLRLREDPAPAAAIEVDEGPSLLAQKIRASKPVTSVPFESLARGFHNNPDNTAALDTAQNYLGAAASVPAGGLIRNGVSRLLNGSARAPRPVHELSQEAIDAYFPGVFRARR